MFIGRSLSVPSYVCGGAVINEQWILTAGHCVEKARKATIYSGSVQLSSPNITITYASEFVLHEDYDPATLSNDIGLIKLQTPLTFDDNTKAIALAEEELEGGTNVTLSGWGQIGDNDPTPNSDNLNYIVMSTIENKACEGYYGSEVVTPGLVCTIGGDPPKNPCLGDSGGPVVLNAFTDPVHVAIFSFLNGYGCEVSYPAGNTRTAYYREWIRKQTGV